MINVAMKILLRYFAAMPNNDALGAKPTDRSDWSDAFEAVSRLAAAREATMDGIKTEDRRGAAVREPTSRRGATSGTVAGTPKQGIDPDQLARAVAEIEKASAALRRSEPTLEVGLPAATRIGTRKKYLSVWILIGSIWISATLVVAGATAGILYVMG
jgi:hypothetical protein